MANMSLAQELEHVKGLIRAFCEQEDGSPRRSWTTWLVVARVHLVSLLESTPELAERMRERMNLG
jgi:hypothetical protein